jgi:hypothetical protein
MEEAAQQVDGRYVHLHTTQFNSLETVKEPKGDVSGTVTLGEREEKQRYLESHSTVAVVERLQELGSPTLAS